MVSFSLVGNITFNPNIKQINNFPPVSPPAVNSYQLFLQKITPAPPIEYGYFIIVPQITFQGNVFELIGQRLRFYEKGIGTSFSLRTPSNLPVPPSIIIGLYPIRLYPNTPISPNPLTFRLGILTEP